MTILQTLAIFCTALLIAQNPCIYAQEAQSGGATQGQAQANLTADQLDSLVAPIALYPDPIVSQVLVASTYPLEVVEAGRWLSKNPNLKGQALADAVRQQTWDASVQALVALPDVLSLLDQNVTWTSDLGNAFLAQEAGVMDAIQRMRKKAMNTGALTSTPQQTVSTENENGQTYIVIQPASPEVVSIPQYDPAAVWGAAPAYYPYPAISYPYTGAAIAAGVISFGAGVAIGAIWGSGGWGNWGWRPGWGHNNVVINNNFIRSNHFNRVNVGNGNAWVHNPSHRGGVPYGNRELGNKYQGAGGRGATRPTTSQVQQRLGGAAGQGSGAANRMAPGNIGQRGGSQANIGSANRVAPGGNIGQRSPGSIGSANRMAPGASGGANSIGNRSIGSARGQGAFGGLNQGGARTQMNSNRGASSFGGGGHRGGGGFRGGGRRR